MVCTIGVYPFPRRRISESFLPGGRLVGGVATPDLGGGAGSGLALLRDVLFLPRNRCTILPGKRKVQGPPWTTSENTTSRHLGE